MIFVREEPEPDSHTGPAAVFAVHRRTRKKSENQIWFLLLLLDCDIVWHNQDKFVSMVKVGKFLTVDPIYHKVTLPALYLVTSNQFKISNFEMNQISLSGGF